MADNIKKDLEVGGVYVTKFEKNDAGFINLKRGTQFKRIEL